MQLWSVFVSSVCNPNPRSIALSISSTFLIPPTTRHVWPRITYTSSPQYIICHVPPSYGRVFGTSSKMVELCRSGRIPTQGPAMAFPRPRTSAGHCYNPPTTLTTMPRHALPSYHWYNSSPPSPPRHCGFPRPSPTLSSLYYCTLYQAVDSMGGTVVGTVGMRDRGTCKKQMRRAHKAEETMQQQSYTSSRKGLFLSYPCLAPVPQPPLLLLHFQRLILALHVFPSQTTLSPPFPFRSSSLSPPPCQYRSASPTLATE